MSGTSVDGVDVAMIETDGERVEAFGPSLTMPYPDDVRRTIRAAFGAEQANEATRTAERLVTDMHIEATRRWSAEHGIAIASLDVVGFHGQTITHRPDRHFTWQLGDGAALATVLGVRVVNDLRGADVKAGGQGAPLVPVYHAALARDLSKPLAVVNIGGVANVTWIDGDGALLAFDTGPGNGPIDDWCARRAGQRFDEEGALAASGKLDRTRLERFSEHRYFAKKPPKSLDRGDFNDSWADGLGVADGAATLTWGTARAIALAARHFPTPGDTMAHRGRRCAQSDIVAGDRRGDARQGHRGSRSRLGRRRSGGSGFCFPRRSFVARPAADISRNDRRAAPTDGRAAERTLGFLVGSRATRRSDQALRDVLVDIDRELVE